MSLFGILFGICDSIEFTLKKYKNQDDYLEKFEFLEKMNIFDKLCALHSVAKNTYSSH